MHKAGFEAFTKATAGAFIKMSIIRQTVPKIECMARNSENVIVRAIFVCNSVYTSLNTRSAEAEAAIIKTRQVDPGHSLADLPHETDGRAAE